MRLQRRQEDRFKNNALAINFVLSQNKTSQRETDVRYGCSCIWRDLYHATQGLGLEI